MLHHHRQPAKEQSQRPYLIKFFFSFLSSFSSPCTYDERGWVAKVIALLEVFMHQNFGKKVPLGERWVLRPNLEPRGPDRGSGKRGRYSSLI